MNKKKTKTKKSQAQKAMSVLGSAGGLANFKKHGRDHMREIVNKRWAKKKKNNLQASEGISP